MMIKNIYIKRMAMFFVKAAVILADIFLFWMVWSYYYSTVNFFNKGNYLLVLVYGAMVFAFAQLYGGYKVGYYNNSNILYSQALSLLFVNFITYFQISLIGRALVNPLPIVALTAIEVVVAAVWVFFASKFYMAINAPKRMVVVYGGDTVNELVGKMSARKDKYEICGTVDAKEGFDAIVAHMEQVEGVIIHDVDSDTRNLMLKYCFEHGITVYLTPKITDILVRGAASVHLFDTPLLLCHNSGLSFEEKVMKRALDVFVSTLALIVTFPLMLVVAIIIKLSDGGHVLHIQKRLTLGGKLFNVYKFRSMVVDAEKDGVARLATQNDERVTPFGKFIRRTRIDELPQFINIVLGDMSLVGPRPERPEIADHYTQSMPEFEYRLKVKAGLTGYAQVMGKYNSTPYDKLKLDLSYIENYSIVTDLKLLLLTAKVLLLPGSTEGVHEDSITAELPKGLKKERVNDNE